MNVTVQKADILPVLSRIQGIVGRKTNLAITTNVLDRSPVPGWARTVGDCSGAFTARA